VEWFVSVLDVGDALPPVLFPLTIHGNGAVLVRDEGAEPFRFFEVMVNSKLVLENITLQGGDVGEDWGGAIYAMSALVELQNVRFINNRAQNGGAVYFDLSALNVQNSEFSGNHATGSGGALYISSSKAIIQSTRFEANSSDGDGGGLYADFVTLLVQDGFFLENRVTGEQYGSRGGGMDVNHVNLTVTESQFYGNESPMYGGAISVNNPQLAGTDPEDGDPIEPLQESPMISDMLTSIPGFQATLEAHPSGIYVEFQEDTQIHNNCFANNITINPQDPNWTSGLSVAPRLPMEITGAIPAGRPGWGPVTATV
jgi:predicted outer membrane repeat protein